MASGNARRRVVFPLAHLSSAPFLKRSRSQRSLADMRVVNGLSLLYRRRDAGHSMSEYTEAYGDVLFER